MELKKVVPSLDMIEVHLKYPCGQVHSFGYTAVPWRNVLQGLGCLLINLTLIIDDMMALI
jgi:hypothetical protein